MRNKRGIRAVYTVIIIMIRWLMSEISTNYIKITWHLNFKYLLAYLTFQCILHQLRYNLNR